MPVITKKLSYIQKKVQHFFPEKTMRQKVIEDNYDQTEKQGERFAHIQVSL